ncbi:hypothetical protein Pst134EA_011979 [Puccinia striiformis f. sp. tritici]|uniref:hypothetical protein n=1 Tax=Puccinia striiformis f. sp. tritici TaxID=168172 RepID=UPI002007292A|nr:hypothetical protein Pst134EA_011979 [Puccinia striiformis f. sp. tritici]KAH9468356.1 hypothetical protein Pst134EA_011979 [Puccinia striiformis f. sp. tritici]
MITWLPHHLQNLPPLPQSGSMSPDHSPAWPPLDALTDSEDSNSFWTYKKTPNGNIIAHYPEDFVGSPKPLYHIPTYHKGQAVGPGPLKDYVFPHDPMVPSESPENLAPSLNLGAIENSSQTLQMISPLPLRSFEDLIKKKSVLGSNNDISIVIPLRETGGKAIAYIWSLQKSTGKHLFFNKRANFEILDQDAEAISKKLLKILEYDSQKNLRSHALAIPKLIDVKGRHGVSMYKARVGQLMNKRLRHFDQKDDRSKRKFYKTFTSSWASLERTQSQWRQMPSRRVQNCSSNFSLRNVESPAKPTMNGSKVH